MFAVILERLRTLETEYEAGRTILAELDARRTSVANTLLRIDGAIAVLKELSSEAVEVNGSSPAPVDGPRLQG